MVTVVLTIHVLIVIALIGVVLLQRSEGGALGMGGGGGGGFMSGRGAANALTRTTSILAALFFATSLGLAIFAGGEESDLDIVEGLTGEEVRDPNAPATTDDLLRTLGSGDDEDGQVQQEGGDAAGLDLDADAALENALDAFGDEANEDAGDETSNTDSDGAGD